MQEWWTTNAINATDATMQLYNYATMQLMQLCNFATNVTMQLMQLILQTKFAANAN